MYQKCWRQMLSWVNISKLLLPFFWSVPVRQRTKMRRKRKSFPILFFFWLSSTQMSLLSDSVFSFRLQCRSVCSLLAVGVTQVTRKPPTQKNKNPPDISSGSVGMRLPSVSVLTCSVRGNDFTHDRCHGVAPSCDVFMGSKGDKHFIHVYVSLPDPVRRFHFVPFL